MREGRRRVVYSPVQSEEGKVGGGEEEIVSDEGGIKRYPICPAKSTAKLLFN